MREVIDELSQEIQSPFLKKIAEKVVNKERITPEEGLELLNSQSNEALQTIRKLADYVRVQKVGDVVHFASTLFIHPTNLCELNCPFCSFYAKPGWKKAWFSTPAQIEEKILYYYPKGLTEIHVVGGLWRECNLDYYRDLFTRIKRIDPNLHIKALTAVEYDFLAKLHRISIEEVFKLMMSWGLGSLPGGGAEILVEEIRKKIAPGKISSDEYLSIHALAHRLGLSSNITMLFGHIETVEDIITHLCRIRGLQDRTGGFKTFIPLKFGQEDNALGKRKKQIKEKNIPLVYAVSRLLLDNITHLKVLWNYVGISEAVEILKWGANDLSSTNFEEKVIQMAGGEKKKMDQDTMSALIHEIGRIPRLTHSGDV
ncbi:MAG: CofH family radical SAM protein [Chlamydiales bacterium]